MGEESREASKNEKVLDLCQLQDFPVLFSFCTVIPSPLIWKKLLEFGKEQGSHNSSTPNFFAVECQGVKCSEAKNCFKIPLSRVIIIAIDGCDNY